MKDKNNGLIKHISAMNRKVHLHHTSEVGFTKDLAETLVKELGHKTSLIVGFTFGIRRFFHGSAMNVIFQNCRGLEDINAGVFVEGEKDLVGAAPLEKLSSLRVCAYLERASFLKKTAFKLKKLNVGFFTEMRGVLDALVPDGPGPGQKDIEVFVTEFNSFDDKSLKKFFHLHKLRKLRLSRWMVSDEFLMSLSLSAPNLSCLIICSSNRLIGEGLFRIAKRLTKLVLEGELNLGITLEDLSKDCLGKLECFKYCFPFMGMGIFGQKEFIADVAGAIVNMKKLKKLTLWFRQQNGFCVMSYQKLFNVYERSNRGWFDFYTDLTNKILRAIKSAFEGDGAPEASSLEFITVLSCSLPTEEVKSIFENPAFKKLKLLKCFGDEIRRGDFEPEEQPSEDPFNTTEVAYIHHEGDISQLQSDWGPEEILWF